MVAARVDCLVRRTKDMSTAAELATALPEIITEQVP